MHFFANMSSFIDALPKMRFNTIISIRLESTLILEKNKTNNKNNCKISGRYDLNIYF